MPTEANLKRAIIAKLKRIPDSKVIDMHRSGRSERGIPDVQFIVCGCPFFFEVKVGRNKPTKLQLLRMDELRLAGAKVFVVRSVNDVLEEISAYVTPSQWDAVSAGLTQSQWYEIRPLPKREGQGASPSRAPNDTKGDRLDDRNEDNRITARNEGADRFRVARPG